MSGSTGHRDKRIADYVRNRADDDTVRQLEIEMLDDDDLFEKVQAEALLHKALEQAEEDDRPARDNGKHSGWIANAGWAVAATFAIGTVLLGVYAIDLENRLENLRKPAVGVPIETVIQQRSPLAGSERSRLDLAAHSGPVLLEFDVSGLAHDHFRVEVVGDQNTIEWQRQHPDQRGYLTVLIPDAAAIRTVHIASPDGEIIHSYVKLEEHRNE